MIYLRTGLPGAGKTLMTLAEVRERATRENRPVFYAGIEILKPDEFPGWQLMDDPAKWYECPDGAIIVHDECQTLYRPRGNGAQVPEYVARYETHRHNGWDIYLITQHPMLLDSNIRRLAGEHCHAVRVFGAEMVTLHRWGQVKEQCDKTRADSVSETKAYPKALYSAYKSATVHTHKRRFPPRLFVLLAIPVLLAGLVWVFSSWFESQKKMPALHDKVTESQGDSRASRALPGAAGPSAGQQGPRAATAEEYLRDRVPRVPGLPHTAPAYDGVTKVARAPVPAACVASVARCVCYTQQGTRLDTPDALCRQIVKDGYFAEFDDATVARSSSDDPGGAARPRRQDQPEGEQHVQLAQTTAGTIIPYGGTWGGVPPVGR